MDEGALYSFEPTRAQTISQNALSIVLGVVFTSGLFLTISHFERNSAPEPMVEMDDLRAVVAPLDPPPPPPVTPQETPPVAMITGFEPGPSDSTVKITVTPPDLDGLLQQSPVAPPAIIQVGQLYTQFKPKMSMVGLQQHIYQPGEVDQLPSVLHHVIPNLSRSMRQKAAALRVTFLVVIDIDGTIKSVRIGKNSTDPDFDALMLENIQEWTFSPAIRKGKPVRCIIEQAVHFTMSHDVPFLL